MEQTKIAYKTDVTIYGAQPDHRSPCVIVRKGQDHEPTCVNPQCPRIENCRRHVSNRESELSPSIAIITWRDCTWYQPIKEEKNGRPTR